MTNEKYLCPACGKPLRFSYAMIWPDEPLYHVWCSNRNCMSFEPATGRTEADAYQDLLDNYRKEKK